jgi:hypothetical protein
MINILGFVIAKQSEINIIKLSQYHEGYEDGTNDALNDINLKQSQVRISPSTGLEAQEDMEYHITHKRISPRTGLPVRKYNKRK